MSDSFPDRMVGVLLGTAVGDALGLPAEGMPAGVGLATAKAIVRLWLGFSPSSSGSSPRATALACGLRWWGSVTPSIPSFGGV